MRRLWTPGGAPDQASIAAATGSTSSTASPTLTGAGPEHVGVEGDPAAEAAADVLQHLRIALERVRVDGGHRAARAQRVEPDHGIADVELRPFPLTLGEALDSADHDVRAQPSDVAAELGHGAVRGDEEREDVEPGEAVERDELRVVARRSPNERERLRRVPRMTVDERPTRRDRACRAGRGDGADGARCARPPGHGRGRSGRRGSRWR